MPVTPGWPDDGAYMEAIQTPQITFSTPRLKAARIYTNDMGIPLAATGRSAIVFPADVESADVALRCFTREAREQQLRYQALHAHLADSIPNYMVNFRYWDSEIMVPGEQYAGERYPVVEMGWVEGQPLHLWVEQNLRYPYRLVRMAAIWRGIMQDLQARDMAHGDLSSDNCLVTRYKLKLIDYDDFFIAELAGSDPGEVGNPDFQHPGRRVGYYALDMDAFPALVIYLSLLAVAADNSLWRRFHKDNNLIFTAEDYTRPHATELWEALDQNSDRQITPLVKALADMCDKPIKDLPPLSQLTPASSRPWWLTRAAWRPPTFSGAPEDTSRPRGVPARRGLDRRRAAGFAAWAAGLVLAAILLILGIGSAAAPAVNSAAFSVGGNTLAAGNTDGSIYLWDVPARSLTATLKSPTGQAVNSAAFSPDGTTLATGNADGSINLWDVPAKTYAATLKSPAGQAVDSAAFSPDGTTLAAADAGGSIYLWDVPAKTLTATLKSPTGQAVNSVAFSPDGKTLAAADADGNTYLWDLPASSLTYAVPDPGKGAVVSVAFSPDGTTLATADAGDSICLWDLPAKSLTADLPNPGKRAVVSVAFSLGGTTLAIVDAGGVVYLWNVHAKPPS